MARPLGAKVSRNRQEYHRVYYRQHPEKTRQYWLKRYGITEEVYQYMLAKQGGHCALCDQTPDKEPRKVLSLDHCHETGRIRGLLCMRHNNGLGMLGDNEAGLLRALKYIREK